MQGLHRNSAQFWPPENVGVKEPLLILFPKSNHYAPIVPPFGPPEAAAVSRPVVVLTPLLGIPDHAGVTRHFRPLLAPQEGRREVATSDFVPLCCGSPRTQGLRRNSAHFWPPEKARVA